MYQRFWRSADHVGPNLLIAAGSATLLASREVTRMEGVTTSPMPKGFSPLPPTRILNPNPNLEICFDARTRTAIYVQHRLLMTAEGNGERSRWGRPRFREDTSIEEHFRSRNSFYSSSGYDRGHLAPAADFPHETVSDTFNLCNVAPQDSAMNRKVWATLEALIRKVAEKASKEQKAVTYVTTGPVWLPTRQIKDGVFEYDLLGIGKPPTVVQVPTHFFKVVVVVDKDHERILQFACFVVPNNAAANSKSLQEYLVPWTDLEKVTGLTFCPQLADKAFRKKADRLTKHQQELFQQLSSQKLLDDGKQRDARRKYRKQLSHVCENHACFPARK